MSIVEVAKKAGVSKSTVSRVINHIPGVAESLRTRVMEAMEELDYRPSSRRPGPKPISRRGVRTGNILMMVAGYDASEVYRLPIFPSILHGAETALAEAGLNLVVAGLRNDGPLPAALSGDQSDGVMLLGSFHGLTAAIRRRLEEMPTIVLLRTFEQLAGPFDRVIYNNRAVGPLAADYLLSKGHTQTAFVLGRTDHMAFEERRQMFGQAMQAAGGEVLELAVDPDDTNPQRQIDDVVKRLKQATPLPTGLCASSDHILPYLYRALRDAGIEPQKDIEIVSCDNDIPVLSAIEPRPSTIDIRSEYVGRLGVRQLRWRLAHPDEEGPITVSIEPKLLPAD